jgi:hypothetical protein
MAFSGRTGLVLGTAFKYSYPRWNYLENQRNGRANALKLMPKQTVKKTA